MAGFADNNNVADFNISAAEMMARLRQKKRRDPKLDSSITLMEKHRIVENM